jgi:hypothetical protein
MMHTASPYFTGSVVVGVAIGVGAFLAAWAGLNLAHIATSIAQSGLISG